MKKIIALLVVMLLFALTAQVAFADPPPVDPDNYGSCHMIASWWEPLPDGGSAPGKALGVDTMDVVDYYDSSVTYEGVQRRGMAMAHYSGSPGEYTKGAIRMDEITWAHCGPEP